MEEGAMLSTEMAQPGSAASEGPRPVGPRPLLGVVFTLIGGVLVLFGGILLLLVPTFFSAFALGGIACGAVLVVVALLMYRGPDQHVAWGIVAIVVGVASIVNLGGFIIGMTFAVVGGALALSWRPGGAPRMGEGAGWTSPAGPYGVPILPWRLCMGCGRWVPWAYNVCPLCGTAAPLAPWVPRAPEAAAGGAPPTVPQAAPVPAPAAIKAPCPTCEAEAEWNPATNAWYCPAERRTF